jgi:hypothetical protein
MLWQEVAKPPKGVRRDVAAGESVRASRGKGETLAKD